MRKRPAGRRHRPIRPEPGTIVRAEQTLRIIPIERRCARYDERHLSHDPRQSLARRCNMKKLFAVACGLLLTGCGGFVFPGPEQSAPMEWGGQPQVPQGANDFQPSRADNQMTSSCTMRGQGVVCR